MELLRMMLALVATQRIFKIHHAPFGVAFRSELLTWTSKSVPFASK